MVHTVGSRGNGFKKITRHRQARKLSNVRVHGDQESDLKKKTQKKPNKKTNKNNNSNNTAACVDLPTPRQSLGHSVVILAYCLLIKANCNCSCDKKDLGRHDCLHTIYIYNIYIYIYICTCTCTCLSGLFVHRLQRLCGLRDIAFNPMQPWTQHSI